jgi:hypothetical protein
MLYSTLPPEESPNPGQSGAVNPQHLEVGEIAIVTSTNYPTLPAGTVVLKADESRFIPICRTPATRVDMVELHEHRTTLRLRRPHPNETFAWQAADSPTPAMVDALAAAGINASYN